MIVRCWVGGCDWHEEGPLSVPLVKAAEDHRAEKHLWVKPGRIHRFDPVPEEPVIREPVLPSGRKARLRMQSRQVQKRA